MDIKTKYTKNLLLFGLHLSSAGFWIPITVKHFVSSIADKSQVDNLIIIYALSLR